jgi:hypothetical protein
MGNVVHFVIRNDIQAGPSDHRLAAHDAIELREIVGETFIIPSKTAPTSRIVINASFITGQILAADGGKSAG